MRTREGDTLEENALLEPDAQKREPSEAPNRYFDSYRAHLDAASEITGASEIRDDPLLDYLAALPAAERTPLTDPFPAHDRVVASVIIPTFDHWFHTAACLHSLAAAHARAPFEVIVADDGSHIPAPDNPLFQGPGLQILRSDHNRGFLHNCNAAARVANGDHLVFLNNDTLVTDHWLDELLASFERFDGVGMVGSLLLQPNGRVSEAGGLVFCDGSAWNFARHRKADDREVRFARDTDYVSGASLCIERRLFESLGGFDPLFAPAYFEDTDLAFRVRRAGKRVIYQPHSRVFHFEGVTSGTDLEQGVKQHQVLNQSTFADRWRKEVAHHGERGVAPEREKDRHFRGRALVIDVCMPTPARDARSHALVIAMKHLRDEGFRVTFVPENLDAPDALAAPLRGSGIEVLGGRDLSSIDEHLLREGRDVDLCWLARRAVDDRWRPVCESRCPGARVATMDLERVDVAVEPTRSEPGEFRGPGFASREDVFVVTGVRDDVVADSLLWLRDEVLPAFRNTALRSTLPPRFVVRERDWLNVVCGPSDALQPIDESQIAEAQTLDRYRIAIAPARFGGDLSGAVGIALSQGLP
ncbi:MAG: glycosyltransferase family 2 protein, partial [bacterium]|nr:glycosyltransferase family 2 protein [bacterium]